MFRRLTLTTLTGLVLLPASNVARGGPNTADLKFKAHHIFVAAADSGAVVEFDENGVFVRSLKPPALASPREVRFGPDGLLYVLSDNGYVLALNILGTVTKTLPVGPGVPTSMAFGAEGHLFVGTDLNRVLEYDLELGQQYLVKTYTTHGVPFGLAFGAHGHL